jgi:hypothetical protein
VGCRGTGLANLLATAVTLAVAITLGLWYLAPALRRRPAVHALTVLVWFKPVDMWQCRFSQPPTSAA